MFRTLYIALVVLISSGCDRYSAERSNAAQTDEKSVINLTEHESSETEGIISKEREAVASGSGLPQPMTAVDLLDCQSVNGTSVYCGYRNPEDLALLPDGSAILVSEMGEFMMDSPGYLSLLDLAEGVRKEIMIDWLSKKKKIWGDEDCFAPDADAFSPHGIDLTTRLDGLHQLLVVNHGKRESVEFFELEEHQGKWSLAWRGCAEPPGDPFINDVSGLTDGGFFVTHMWDKGTPFEKIVERYANGENTGWVWEWQPEAGFSKLTGSDQLMPNGIAVSPENDKIFLNAYGGNKTIRIDRDSGEVEAYLEVQQPDNITIDLEGSLWVASHRHDPLGQTCATVSAGPCLLPFEVLKVDAETFKAEVVVSENRPPMGYVTVALRVGDLLYMGSAHGDRIASRELFNSGI